jgi:Flp pilus assembly protein TadG
MIWILYKGFTMLNFNLQRTRHDFLRQRGAAAVEFALLLPVLLSLFLGVVDLGLAVYTQSVLSNASREGARAGVVLALTRPSSQTIANVVQTYLSNSMGSVNKFGTLSFTPPSPCVDANGQLTVQMTYSFKGFAMGAVASAFSQPIVLSAKTTMACE